VQLVLVLVQIGGSGARRMGIRAKRRSRTKNPRIRAATLMERILGVADVPLIAGIHQLWGGAAGSNQIPSTAAQDLLSMTNHTVESAWRVPAGHIGGRDPLAAHPVRD
jgi:hypothetical protein